jgi:CubicO group peptidase (beta-lactamase class C family)
MLYSSGSSHLLSAVLTRASGRSTHALAREWLGEPLGIEIPPWPRDPQGIFFGGNDMLMSPRALLRFGELYRRDGVLNGRRILPEGWVAESWRLRTTSPWSFWGRLDHTFSGYGEARAEVSTIEGARESRV